MNKLWKIVLGGTMAIQAVTWASAQEKAPDAKPTGALVAAEPNAAVVAAPRKDEGWIKRNESFNTRAKQGAEKGDIGLIFMGDSITHQWETAGKSVWEEFYAKRGAVNFGIGGDRTQHLLWRIQNGNLEGLAKPTTGQAPKLVVMMIGTNNSNKEEHTGAEIGDGIKACIAAVREKLPEAKVLLLSIFPRGETPGPQREKNAEASRIAAEAADGTMVHYMDIGGKFVEADGTIKKEIMPDYLHLSEAGYRRWAEAIEAKVAELMGEKK